MSSFTKALTNKGIALQAKAQTGIELKYTRFVLGDGRLNGQAMSALTNVINPKKTMPVTKLRMEVPNQATVGFVLSNQDVTSGFYFRELGLYANDPDEGEILYLYANAGDTADYIPAAGGSDIIEESFDVLAFVGQAPNVSAVINKSLVYVTHPELEEAIANIENKLANNFKGPSASITEYPEGYSIFYVGGGTGGQGSAWRTAAGASESFGYVETVRAGSGGYQTFTEMYSGSDTVNVSNNKQYKRNKRDSNAFWQPFEKILDVDDLNAAFGGWKVYNDITELGLTVGTETIDSIVQALPDKSELRFMKVTANTSAAYPATAGVLHIKRYANYRVEITFANGDGNGPRKWYGYYDTNITPNFTGWQEIIAPKDEMPNLIANSSGLMGLTGWTHSKNTTASGEWSTTVDTVYGGYFWSNSAVTSGNLALDSDIIPSPSGGGTYHLQATFLSKETGSGVLGVQILDANTGSFVVGLYKDPYNTEWHRKEMTFTLPSGISRIKVRLINQDTTTTEWKCITRIKLARTNKDNPYSAEGDIRGLNAKFNEYRKPEETISANLLKNSTGLLGLQNWTNATPSLGQWWASEVDPNTKSCFLTSGTGAGAAHCLDSDVIPVTTGGVYDLQVMFNTSGITTGAVYAEVYDSGKTKIVGQLFADLNKGWDRKKMKVPIPAGITGVIIRLVVSNTSEGNKYFSRIKFSRQLLSNVDDVPYSNEADTLALFQSVNNGKSKLETVIIDYKGVVSKTDGVATFDQLVAGIRSIPSLSGKRIARGTTTSNTSGYFDVSGLSFAPGVVVWVANAYANMYGVTYSEDMIRNSSPIMWRSFGFRNSQYYGAGYGGTPTSNGVVGIYNTGVNGAVIHWMAFEK